MSVSKKVLSVGLAAVLAASMIPAVGVFAADEEIPTLDQIKVGEDYQDLKASIKVLTNRTDIVDTVYKGYADEFMKMYPNIKVEYEGITDYEQSLELRLTTGDWGDLCFIPTSVDKSELSSYFTPLGDYDTLDQTYNFVQDKSYEGTVYGIANGGTASGIVYNKRVWKEAGIDERLAGEGTAAEEETRGKVKILAVTSCPTGIAHTYMAAEGIEKAAKAKDCAVKVETRGSGGAKNVLTSKEIEEADGIIVAADAQVPMDRFDGKKVIVCQVSDGISKAGELVDRVISGDVPVYHAANGAEVQESKGGRSSGSIGHQIYTQLMNGVSHMLPFVVGGGILIALAFLIDGLCVDMNALAKADRANFGTITPVAAQLKTIGGLAFGLMLPVLAGYIGEAIGDRPALAVGFVGGVIAANGKSGFLGALVAGFVSGYLILLLRKLCDKLPDALEKIAPVLIYPVAGILGIGLLMNFAIEPVMGAINTALNNGLTGMGGSSKLVLGLILGGMMAIDMGGPFNKAAYAFGIAAIAAGNYDIMAAVMIGGMTPPCAIALATLLFKDKFTKSEREAGPTNFIMGLAFITEGAIPYAAADPLHVLPACIAGSAAAGALSMAFGCTLMAPHGGIFVFPVVGNAIMYLVALVAGTVISAILLGVLKKKII